MDIYRLAVSYDRASDYLMNHEYSLSPSRALQMPVDNSPVKSVFSVFSLLFYNLAPDLTYILGYKAFKHFLIRTGFLWSVVLKIPVFRFGRNTKVDIPCLSGLADFNP